MEVGTEFVVEIGRDLLPRSGNGSLPQNSFRHDRNGDEPSEQQGQPSEPADKCGLPLVAGLDGRLQARPCDLQIVSLGKFFEPLTDRQDRAVKVAAVGDRGHTSLAWRFVSPAAMHRNRAAESHVASGGETFHLGDPK